MWYMHVRTSLFHFITMHAFDRWTYHHMQSNGENSASPYSLVTSYNHDVAEVKTFTTMLQFACSMLCQTSWTFSSYSHSGCSTTVYFSDNACITYCVWWLTEEGTCLCSYSSVSSPISGTTWTHTYATEGTYSVNVTCYNNVSTQSVVVPQYIQAPIVNLRLRHDGALVVSIAS